MNKFAPKNIKWPYNSEIKGWRDKTGLISSHEKLVPLYAYEELYKEYLLLLNKDRKNNYV